MGETTEDTFRSALCCYLNMLHLKGKTYAPAEIFIAPLAGKVLNDTSPRGYRQAYKYLLNSQHYVYHVSKVWTLHTCLHCSCLTRDPIDGPPIVSLFFLHNTMTRRCRDLCLTCGEKIKTCINCNRLCICCEDRRELVTSYREQHPAHFFSNCVTSTQNLRRMKDGPLSERCCAKLYHIFDDMTRLYWQEHCDSCQDRVECLLVRD